MDEIYSVVVLEIVSALLTAGLILLYYKYRLRRIDKRYRESTKLVVAHMKKEHERKMELMLFERTCKEKQAFNIKRS